MAELTLKQERKQLVDDAIAFRPTKRIPLVGNEWTWHFLDRGYNLEEVIFNYDLLEKLFCEVVQDYQYDVYPCIGLRNPMRITHCLGGGRTLLAPDKMSVYQEDRAVMERDEYPLLIENQQKLLWEKAMPRICGENVTYGDIHRAGEELVAWQNLTATMRRHVFEEGQALDYFGGVSTGDPLHTLFHNYRGLKEFALDLRKSKKELLIIRDQFLEQLDGILETAKGRDSSGAMVDLHIGMLLQNFLNPSQFKTLLQPFYEKVIGFAVENHMTVNAFAEGTVLQIADYLQTVPKGVLCIQVENDDVFEFRKRLPNVAIIGGMPSTMLGRGTKQECLDYAKKLIDTLGEGFLFSTDKMLSFKNDAKRENLLAVTDFVRNYHC